MDVLHNRRGRLALLRELLKEDPHNLRLISDAAWSAFNEGQFEECISLIGVYAAKADLPTEMRNLKGSAHTGLKQYDVAIDVFAALREAGNDSPEIRFNQAWAHAMRKEYGDALHLLDPLAVGCSPHGPSLKVQMLHHQGDLDHALEVGRSLLLDYPADSRLMAALAVLALDAGDLVAADDYAIRSETEPQSRMVRGMLELGQHQLAEATQRFDEVLSVQPESARAWTGKGLSLLASGHPKEAAPALLRGAELFGSHQGSWIAAGWAFFLGGDKETARTAFNRSLSIDPNFSESHGGLAVVAVSDGDITDAEHHAEVALRLDRQSLGGILAKTLLLDRSGHGEAAQRLREIATSSEIGPGGETLGQLLIRLNVGN
jgi:tetratricopeptide (TPR) repeat protein